MAATSKTVDVIDADVVETDSIDEAVVATGATNVVEAIKGLNNPEAAFYSSIKGTDFGAKLKVAAALSDSKPVDEHLGETIALKDFIVQPVDLANEDGEVTTAPRVVLIAADGVAYHATSVGLLSALRNLNSVAGEPHTWESPISIKFTQQKGRNGFKFMTFNVVAA